MSKTLRWLWCSCRDIGHVYKGQSSDPYRRYKQHDIRLRIEWGMMLWSIKPFHMHFDLEVKYSTSQKYWADRKKKELIIVLKSNSTAGYNLLQGCPSSDLLYGLEKGNHEGEMLLLNLLFSGSYLTFPVYMFYSENKGMLFWYWLPSQLWLAPLVMVFFTCERIHVSCPWEAALNCASNYSSCCSKTLSFSFKTPSLLLVTDSTYSDRFPAQPKSLHVSTSVSNLQQLQIHVSADLSDIQR